MIKRQSLCAAIGLALVAVTLLLGCSSDDNGGTNPYTKKSGDLNDPIFGIVRQEMQVSVDYSQGMLREIFRMLGAVDSMFLDVSGHEDDTTRDHHLDDAVFHESSGYWVNAYVDTSVATNTVPPDTAYEFYADSVQFLHGSVPVQFPDSLLLTSIKIASRHSLSEADTPDSLSIGMQVTVSGQPGVIARRGNALVSGTGTLNGFFDDYSPSGPDTACVFSFGFTVQFINLEVNIDNVFYGAQCPTDGRIRHTGYLVSECGAPSDSLDYEKQWSSVTTFDGQNVKFTIENPTTRWIFETTCDYFTALPSQPEEQLVASKR